MRWGAQIVAAGILVAATTTGTATAAPKPRPQPTVYIAGGLGTTMIPIDGATGNVGSPIDYRGTFQHFAITPDGNLAVGTDVYSRVVRMAGLAVGATPHRVGVDGFGQGIAIMPDGLTAWFVRTNPDRVTAVDIATRKIGVSIKLPAGCNGSGVAIEPGDERGYVACNGLSEVQPVDLGLHKLVPPVHVFGPTALAITPDSATVLAVSEDGNEVVAIDTTAFTTTTIPTGADPTGIAITPDGRTAYVAIRGEDAVQPIDIATGTAGALISGIDNAYDIAITPDGTTAYVTQLGQEQVSRIDIATGTLLPPIDTPVETRIAIAPDQAPVAHLSATPMPHGSPTTFDASASTVRYGRIVRYDWDFGDGTTASTKTPTTTHTYATARTFQPAVTETDSAGTSTTIVFTGQTMLRNGNDLARAVINVRIT